MTSFYIENTSALPQTSSESSSKTSFNLLSSKKPYDPSLLTDEEKSRINCFLEEESVFEDLNRLLCEKRACIYIPSEYLKIPSCFFNNSFHGYTSVHTDNNVYTLKRKNVLSPFDGAIDDILLTVKYLDDETINVKVKF